MANLESPNQMGNKGNEGGSSASASGGKIQSPREVGQKGNDKPFDGSAPGGKIVSPGGAGNASEANGHQG